MRHDYTHWNLARTLDQIHLTAMLKPQTVMGTLVLSYLKDSTLSVECNNTPTGSLWLAGGFSMCIIYINTYLLIFKTRP